MTCNRCAPGTDTTAAFIEFSILYLITFPETQEKVHEELARVLGDRRPSLEDRDQLPYTMAFLAETARYMPMLMVPPSRTGPADVQLKNGMIIPKYTQVTIVQRRLAKHHRFL